MKPITDPSLIFLNEVLVFIRNHVPPENRLLWQQMIEVLHHGSGNQEMRIKDLERRVYQLERRSFEGFGEDWQAKLLADIEMLQDFQRATEEDDNAQKDI